jgi:hypothetical protein
VSLCNGIVRKPGREKVYPVGVWYSEWCGPPSVIVTMLYKELLVIASLVVLFLTRVFLFLEVVVVALSLLNAILCDYPIVSREMCSLY